MLLFVIITLFYCQCLFVQCLFNVYLFSVCSMFICSVFVQCLLDLLLICCY